MDSISELVLPLVLIILVIWLIAMFFICRSYVRMIRSYNKKLEQIELQSEQFKNEEKLSLKNEE